MVTNMEKDPQRDGQAVACYSEQTQLGEGIRWDDRRRELLAVDILAGRVARGRVRDDHSIERIGVYQLPTTVGMIAPIHGDDGWVLGSGRSFVHLALDGIQRTIAEVAPAGTRMNDGACDPQGRFWGGTLADDHHPGGGALYRLDPTGRTKVVLERPDHLQRNRLESRRPDHVPGRQRPPGDPRLPVRRQTRGTISAGRVLLTVPEDIGAPDGMTVTPPVTCGWRSTAAGGSTTTHPTARCARCTPSRPRRSRAVPSAAPACTTSSSPPRPKVGPMQQRRADPAAGLVYRSTPIPPAARQRRSIPTRPGGKTSAK